MTVHNHGPEEGPGLNCRELVRLPEGLIGACIYNEEMQTRKETPVVEPELIYFSIAFNAITKDQAQEIINKIGTIDNGAFTTFIGDPITKEEIEV